MRFRMGLAVALLLLAGSVLAGCGRADDAAVKTARHVVDQGQKLKLLNDTADEMYSSLKEGKVIEARDALLRFEDELTTIPYNGITDADGVRALTEAVYEAKKAFNRVYFSMNEGMRAALTLRLAADSLTHPHQPMWHQYYKSLRENVERMQAAAGKRDPAAFKQGLDEMRANYALIRPSIIINHGMEPAVQADSLFAHAERVAAGRPFDAKAGVDVCASFQQAWDAIFGRKDQNAYAPLVDHPSDAWPAALLSLIALVLGYVGWQKYKYQPAYTVIRRDEE